MCKNECVKETGMCIKFAYILTEVGGVFKEL